jgi:hypothetical protein
MPLPPLLLCLALRAAGGSAVDAKEAPEQAVDRLTAAILDAHGDPTQRAQAVQAMGVLLGTTERMVKFAPETEREMGFFTLGASELLFGVLLRQSVVPEARYPDIGRTLGQAYCDPTPGIRASARRVLRDAYPTVATPAYAQALFCPDPSAPPPPPRPWPSSSTPPPTNSAPWASPPSTWAPTR